MDVVPECLVLLVGPAVVEGGVRAAGVADARLRLRRPCLQPLVEVLDDMQQGRRDVGVVRGLVVLAPLLDALADDGGEQDALDSERTTVVAQVLEEPDDLAQVAASDDVLLLEPGREADRVRLLELVGRRLRSGG